MRIYLDNCCFNRPYDDQRQERIFLETIAKLYIQKLIVNNQADFVWSYILEYENWCNPFVLRKEAISQFSKRAKFNIDIHRKSEVLELALKISATGIKEKDSLHVACALLADCDYFISTDDRVLKYSSEKMQVVNPIAFVLRWED